MRSIRRSLLGYLLVLLALGLSAVGVLVDRFAQAAIVAREEAETRRIDQTLDTRRQEVKAQLDAELVVEAKALSREVQRALNRAFGQGGRGPGGPPPGPPAAAPKGDPPRPAPTADLSPLKAPSADVVEYRRRAAGLLLNPSPWHVLGNGLLLTGYQSPMWSSYEASRAAPRLQLQETLRRLFDEEEHTGYFQFTILARFPGQEPRAVGAFHPARVGQVLPLDVEALERPNVEFVHDDVTLPGKGRFRRIVMPGSRQYYFWLPVQAPVNIAPPFGGGGGAFRGFRPPDFSLSIVVHQARSYSELDSRLASEQENRDHELQQMHADTNRELTTLRTRLILIGLGSFLALVFGGWFIVARGLSPIHKLSSAVGQVSEKDFRLTVEPDDMSRELLPIIGGLRTTLDSLRAAFEREKQAVGDISHELRTPIASMLATLDVALRKPRTAEQYRTTLEDCRGIARQLGGLVERIMSLASLDAGAARDSIQFIDAANLASDCTAIIRPLAEAHGLQFSLRSERPLDLETDADKLREVLMNLLHNAVEYNRPGGTVEFVARRLADRIVFEVRDTGIGMTPAVVEKVFERFFRADPSRHATGIHAGLGLAIVKEYVNRLGGTISVESELDVGTTFRVELPAVPLLPPEESDEFASAAEYATPDLRAHVRTAPTIS